jgi:hypothetical protein
LLFPPIKKKKKKERKKRKKPKNIILNIKNQKRNQMGFLKLPYLCFGWNPLRIRLIYV